MSLSAGGIDRFFQDDSPLAGHLRGFSPRPEQAEMARQVVHAMCNGRNLAIEAGAGTGKTLAYLVPALLSGQRTVVATGTRTLQDQLYHRDLPVLDRALGRPASVAQLKGRSNYLCIYRLRRARQPQAAAGRQLHSELRRVEQWAARTRAGDIGELTGISESAAVWPLVTSTADNCLGGRCPNLGECHVVAARKRAVESDLIIVNHHLLLADLALKDDGFGRLLPGTEVAVVDEAHRFPETAQTLLDRSLSSRQLEELLRDTTAEATQAGTLDVELRQRIDSLLEHLARARAAAAGSGEPLAMDAADPALSDALGAIAQDLGILRQALLERAELSAGLDRCGERVADAAGVAETILGRDPDTDLCWVQAGRDSFALHLTPLDCSARLGDLLEAQSCTWIFTSATLAVGDDFGHFAGRLGLRQLDSRRIDSPFDYASCARLLLPAGLPGPDAPDYVERVVAVIEPLLRTSRGRAFLLFTSRRALQQAATLLGAMEHEHTLLVQGSASRSRLLDAFVRSEGAVLLGTATFWEGVDIRGPALVVVAIDRLPFASPGDPFLQARLELVRRQGGDPFRDYQLPQAVLALRQGVGRLIRGYDDYGVVVICDPRLTSRSYGRVFVASLPAMPVVRDVGEACAFLASREGGQ